MARQPECPPAADGMERFACPTPDRQGRYRCIDDHVLCDGFIDCPAGEDEDRQAYEGTSRCAGGRIAQVGKRPLETGAPVSLTDIAGRRRTAANKQHQVNGADDEAKDIRCRTSVSTIAVVYITRRLLDHYPWIESWSEGGRCYRGHTTEKETQSPAHNIYSHPLLHVSVQDAVTPTTAHASVSPKIQCDNSSISCRFIKCLFTFIAPVHMLISEIQYTIYTRAHFTYSTLDALALGTFLCSCTVTITHYTHYPCNAPPTAPTLAPL
ncbi:jelly belly [Carabus blaptoides fortunei]